MTNTLKATAIAFMALLTIGVLFLSLRDGLIMGTLSGAIVLIANLLTED
jgi:hypothetical protein